MIKDNSIEHDTKTHFKHYGPFENSSQVLSVEKNLQKGERLPDIKLQALHASRLNGRISRNVFSLRKKTLETGACNKS